MTETVELRADAETIREEWEDLAARVGNYPFLRPGWIDAITNAFSFGTLHAFTVRRRGRLAAILPMRSARGALRSPTNWYTPSFGPLAEDGDAVAELARAVLRTRPRSVAMQFVDLADPLVGAWCAETANVGWAVDKRTLETSPYLDIDGDWEAYEARLDSKVRADLRRRLRRLEELGSVEVEYADGTERLDLLLEEGFRVEAAGWKGAEGTAIVSSGPSRRIYTDAARWAAEEGWLQLAFLRVDGEAIAFEFNVVAFGTHYRLKGGYDEKLQKFAPGKLLQRATIEHAFRSGLNRYDFGGTHEPYKLEWCPTLRELSLVQAFSPSLPGRAEQFAWRRVRPLAKEVLGRVRSRVKPGPSA